MKRKNKNIIMLIMLIILLGSLTFTIYKFTNLNNEIPNLMMDNNFGRENMNERPEISNEEFGNKMDRPNEKDDSTNKEMKEPPENKNFNFEEGNRRGERKDNKVVYYILFGIEGLLISLIIIYLISSNFNVKTIKEVFSTKEKIIVFIISNIILTSILFVAVLFVSDKLFSNNMPKINNSEQEKENIILDKTNVVTDNNIVLNDYSTNVVINKSGTYIISGEFTYSIIIDTDVNDEVVLILDNVIVNNSKTASIIALSGKQVSIITNDNTISKLSDGGYTEYDSCIYSEIPLIFEGKGELTINGNQEEGISTKNNDITINSGTINVISKDDGINAGGDEGGTITINGGNITIDASGDGIDSNDNAVINGGTLFVVGSDIGGDSGIDTDNGYIINGGEVIALGTDMIEVPEKNSSQKTIAFSFKNAINKDIKVKLVKNGKTITEFVATKSFKTIIISNKKIIDGNYSLEIDNKEQIINNSNIFEVNDIVNLFSEK